MSPPGDMGGLSIPARSAPRPADHWTALRSLDETAARSKDRPSQAGEARWKMEWLASLKSLLGSLQFVPRKLSDRMSIGNR